MSKTSISHLAAIIISILLSSCGGQKAANENMTTGENTLTFCFKDSCEHLIYSLSLEVPAGNDSASMLMRDSLVADFIRNVKQPGWADDGSNLIKTYEGDKSDIQALVEHYGKAGYKILLAMAMDDYNQRLAFLEEDTTMSADDKKRIKEDVPMWAFESATKKTLSNESFVVYTSNGYVYYGGAHGGVTGTGAMTFDRHSGQKIERFIKADAAKAMQPMIRRGLIQYYSWAGDTITDAQLSERLQIEGTIVPLPQQAAMPNAAGDSLCLTYGQYEIACYADGMPSFPLAVKDILPYLTPEAKALLKAGE